jgi:hypothetical protein
VRLNRQKVSLFVHLTGRDAYRIALLFLIAMLSSGCGPYASVLRHDGYSYMQRGFESLPSSSGLHKVFIINNLKIHVVDHQKQFDHVPFRNSSVVGYATPFELWVIGKEVNGKIILNWAVIGHELIHMLSFYYPDLIANPDSYEVLGAFMEDQGPE